MGEKKERRKDPSLAKKRRFYPLSLEIAFGFFLGPRNRRQLGPDLKNKLGVGVDVDVRKLTSEPNWS